MLTLTLESTIPTNYLDQINDCVKYWNDSGDQVFEKNKSGIYGDPETQKLANTLRVEDFIMHMFAIDCNNVFNDDSEYSAGKSGSHVWIHSGGNRIAIAVCKTASTFNFGNDYVKTSEGEIIETKTSMYTIQDIIENESYPLRDYKYTKVSSLPVEDQKTYLKFDLDVNPQVKKSFLNYIYSIDPNNWNLPVEDLIELYFESIQDKPKILRFGIYFDPNTGKAYSIRHRTGGKLVCFEVETYKGKLVRINTDSIKILSQDQMLEMYFCGAYENGL
jgi:hypothetical protein